MERTVKIEINEQQKAVTGTVQITSTEDPDLVLAETKRLFAELRTYTDSETKKKLGLY